MGIKVHKIKTVNAFIRSKLWKSLSATLVWKLAKATKVRRVEAAQDRPDEGGARESHGIHTAGPGSDIKEYHGKGQTLGKARRSTTWKAGLKSHF